MKGPKNLTVRIPGAARRVIRNLLRAALLRYVRAQPRPGTDTPDKVIILLVSAWGMGGTIRVAINLANYLSSHRDVEIISTYRRRDEPQFPIDPRVKVVALDDQRPAAVPRRLRLIRRVLRGVPSALYHRLDRRSHNHNLWTDVQLVRRLRRATGIVIANRPGHNVLIVDLAVPGLVTIGHEHMHLDSHAMGLRRAMLAAYGDLDALAVLTHKDKEAYEAVLNGQRPPVWRVRNSVSGIQPPRADLSSKTILAAGRYTWQKGFDFLIPAFGSIAADHPDWHLRICGSGSRRDYKTVLLRQIEEHDLGERVELAGPSNDLAGEMARASIYALSSRYEGFPLVLIEAMSKGMAVVAFDCPTGPADIVEDRRNGILVPPKDVPAFADGLRAFIEDEELRRRCADGALETARDYTMATIGPEWDALLATLPPARGRAFRA